MGEKKLGESKQTKARRGNNHKGPLSKEKGTWLWSWPAALNNYKQNFKYF